jgi:signal transduction histidine kinase
LERVLGWSKAELEQCDILVECYPDPEYRQSVLDFMVAATGKWQDLKTKTHDGRVIYTSWANIRLSDGTSIGIGQDITERKLAEESLQIFTQQERERALQLEQTLKELQRTQAQLVQNEKMASLGQLVAGVAHEINNPTSFISCNIHPASEYAQDLLNLLKLYQNYYPEPVAEITEQLERIEPEFIAQDFPKLLASMKEGANRIKEIVLSLKNFSRLDEADRKRVNIHEGIDNTLLILRHRLKSQSKCPEIQVIKEYGQLPLIECYPGQLNQVFMNLLSNAIDALRELHIGGLAVEGSHQSLLMKVGQGLGQEERESHCSLSRRLMAPNCQGTTPYIRIRTETLEQDKVVICVADNGSGVSEEDQQRVFDPFFTTKSPGEGTGLGLSISYQIVVEKHKGRLRCRSTPGQGTEFIIELPTAQCRKA